MTKDGLRPFLVFSAYAPEVCGSHSKSLPRDLCAEERNDLTPINNTGFWYFCQPRIKSRTLLYAFWGYGLGFRLPAGRQAFGFISAILMVFRQDWYGARGIFSHVGNKYFCSVYCIPSFAKASTSAEATADESSGLFPFLCILYAHLRQGYGGNPIAKPQFYVLSGGNPSSKARILFIFSLCWPVRNPPTAPLVLTCRLSIDLLRDYFISYIQFLLLIK